MSALNIFVDRGAAHIVTDAAAAGVGVMFGYINKTLVLPHIGVVLGFRGKVSGIEVLKFALSNFDDKDALLAGIGDLLKGFYRIRRKLMPRAFGLEVGIIGYSEGAPFAYLISTCDRQDAPAYKLLEVPFLWTSPITDPEKVTDIATMLSSDLDGSMISLLSEQRRSEECFVGGYGQIISIDAKGIHTRLLCKWPDKIGRRVDRSAVAVPSAMQSYTKLPLVGDYRNA